MGNLCGSPKAQADDEARREEEEARKRDEASSSSGKKPKGLSKPSSTEVEEKDKDWEEEGEAKKEPSDRDWRETVKHTLCHALERLAQQLEHESDAYHEVAQSMEKDNMIELFSAKYFERLFNECLELPEAEEMAKPPVAKSHVLYEYHRFLAVISAARNASFKKPYPSRKELAQKVSSAARKTREALKAATAACDKEELREPLDVFVRVFDTYAAKDLDTALFSHLEELCG